MRMCGCSVCPAREGGGSTSLNLRWISTDIESALLTRPLPLQFGQSFIDGAGAMLSLWRRSFEQAEL